MAAPTTTTTLLARLCLRAALALGLAAGLLASAAAGRCELYRCADTEQSTVDGVVACFARTNSILNYIRCTDGRAADGDDFDDPVPVLQVRPGSALARTNLFRAPAAAAGGGSSSSSVVRPAELLKAAAHLCPCTGLARAITRCPYADDDEFRSCLQCEGATAAMLMEIDQCMWDRWPDGRDNFARQFRLGPAAAAAGPDALLQTYRKYWSSVPSGPCGVADISQRVSRFEWNVRLDHECREQVHDEGHTRKRQTRRRQQAG